MPVGSWCLCLPGAVVSPALAAAVGEHAAWAERLGDPGRVDGRGKDRINPRQADMPKVRQRGFLEEVDPCEQVPFVGVGSRQLGGFPVGELLDYRGYRASVLGIQDGEIEIVRLADDLGRVKLRYFPDAADAELVEAAAGARAEAIQAGQDARMAGEQRPGFGVQAAHLRGLRVEDQVPGTGQFRVGPFAVLPERSMEAQLPAVRVEGGFDREDTAVRQDDVEIVRPRRCSGNVTPRPPDQPRVRLPRETGHLMTPRMRRALSAAAGCRWRLWRITLCGDASR